MQASEKYLAEANYYQAYWALEDARRARPTDPDLERRFWELRVLYLLAESRDLVFHDQDLEALRRLERVQVLDPENSVAQTWIRKAKRKLAARAIDEGKEQLIAGELASALKSFNEALTYQPDDPEALVGIEELDAIWSSRRESAQDWYMQGIRASAEQNFVQTQYHMNIALDQDPSLDRAKPQLTRAIKRLAEQRLAGAKALEAEGYFAPALSDYLLVQETLPETPEIDEMVARMRAEVKADDLANEGEMEVFRGDFAKARKLLEEAYEMSTMSKLSIGEKLQLVNERELDYMYMDARDLELEYRYEISLAAYRTIADSVTSGFRDVLSRINDLEASIAAAEQGYADGQKEESAGQLEAALGHYQEVMIHYPGYQDIEDRARDLKARISDVANKPGK